MTTLLEFCDRLAKNVGLSSPDTVYASSDPTWQEALVFANEVGQELRRRFDWGELYFETNIVGTGTNQPLSLPSDLSRLAKGTSVRHATGTVRPLTQREWGDLTPVEGNPRYYLKENNKISFWPYLANSDTVTVGYIQEGWCDGGAQFASDGDTVIFDDDLFTQGLIVRWRRQKGMDYADFEAEYEATLQDHANFDRNARF